jgi:hypothetical protein
VGGYGTILKTTDGGNNWIAQTSGTTDNLHSVYFTSSTIGWVVGGYGTILKTSDGVQDTTWELNVRGGIGLGYTTSSLKSDPAHLQKIGNSGIGGMLNGSIFIIYKSFPFIPIFNIDGGYSKFDDYNSFSENTTAGTKGSTLMMTYASISIGMLYPFNNIYSKVIYGLGINLGSEVFSGTRFIENCIDCSDEDLSLRAGVFLEPFLQIFLSHASSFNFSYRLYQSNADLNDKITLKYILYFLLISEK